MGVEECVDSKVDVLATRNVKDLDGRAKGVDLGRVCFGRCVFSVYLYQADTAISLLRRCECILYRGTGGIA